MIDIVENEPLIEHINEFDGILIGTNCYQVMRNGFQYDISKKYPIIKEVNNQTKYADKNKLGSIIEHMDTDGIQFVLMFITFGYNFKGDNKPFIDYTALTQCLKLINAKYKNKHFATTLIGTTQFDGNADKQIILDIINKEITNLHLTIFDYQQLSGNTIHQRKYLKERFAR